jgi:hypothetical protein
MGQQQCVAFFALVILFSGFITIAGRLDEDCVRVGSDTFAEAGAPFADAFALSWTTISTVSCVWHIFFIFYLATSNSMFTFAIASTLAGGLR